ncbi:unnamed protein product [Brachionus calyciflorus]|uniref:Uncharacterized protein n=1 Tax=Brachionus calyciflorus TaxID=104777 RepID=A0A814F701_9BILA|nr:unnamed protein product [Brachionus calyciflorus]
MKHVGEAVRQITRSKDKVILLGIANWTTVAKKDDLVIKKNQSDDGHVIYRINSDKLEPRSVYLEPNHSHFILVDDSKYNKFGGEISFRADLESEISKAKKIPIVLVVVEGGPNTVTTVLESLKKKIPCVIIDNSGKISDLLSYIYKALEESDDSSLKESIVNKIFKFEEKFRNYIYEKLNDEFSSRDKDIDQIVNQIEEIFEPSRRHLITIFELNPTKQDSDLDEAILNAFYKANSRPKLAELILYKDREVIHKHKLNTGDLNNNLEIFKELMSKKIVTDHINYINLFDLIKEKRCVILDKTRNLSYLFKQLKDASKQTPKQTPNKTIEEIAKSLVKNLQHNNGESVSIFELDPDILTNKNLNNIILSAFLKANPKYKVAELCLSWNRVDIARKTLFNDDIPDNMDMYQDLMFSAILKNRVQFVNLLLENGFSLKNFLTHERLLKLYKEASVASLLSSLFRKILKMELENKTNFYNVGRIIQNLVDNLFRHEFTHPQFNKVECREKEEKNDKEILDIEECPEYHLFIFNILLGRYELSKIFWNEGENQISNALIAYKILKSMAKLFEESSTDLLKMANKYEQLACDSLTKSNELNEIKTEYLLIRPVRQFSHITVLQIANSGECLNFLSHPECQNFLEKIWYHKIYPNTPSYRIYLSMIFPLVAPIIVHFGDKKSLKTREVAQKKAKTKILPDEIKTEIKNNFSKNVKKLDFLNPYEELNYWTCLNHFLKAPYVKFIYDQFSYLMFLILFSYIMLCDFYPVDIIGKRETKFNTYISVLEIVLIIWILTFTCEEIRQFYLNENRVAKAKIKSFLFDFKNMLEIIGLCLFYVGMILRFIPNYKCYLAARIILCIDILFWYIRALFAYTFIKKMGPKLLMIRKLALNLAYFFLIILVFFFAFGISTQSLLFQNQQLNTNLLRNVFFPSYFVLIGDYYTLASMTQADENCISTEDNICPDYLGSQVSLVIYIVYLLFLNILLLNILIALFNKTFEKIQQASDPLWKFSRYLLVFEYYHKPLIPPPFIIIYYFTLGIRHAIHLILKIFNQETINNSMVLKKLDEFSLIYFPGFYFKTSDDENERLVKWERCIIDELIYKIERENSDKKEFKLQQNLEKLEELAFQYSKIVQSQRDAEKKLEIAEKNLNKIAKLLDDRKKANKKADLIQNKKAEINKSPSSLNLEKIISSRKFDQENYSPNDFDTASIVDKLSNYSNDIENEIGSEIEYSHDDSYSEKAKEEL